MSSLSDLFPRQDTDQQSSSQYLRKDDDDSSNINLPRRPSTFWNNFLSSESNNKESASVIRLKELNNQFLTCNLIIVIVVIVLYVGVGVGAYHDMLEWSRLDAFYFVVVTATTIGMYINFQYTLRNMLYF